MGTSAKTLYDTDFVEWAAQTADLLRQGRFDQVDLDNLAEEIDALGKSEQRAVQSRLGRMLMHLIEQRIQPDREGTSWRSSIIDARREIDLSLEDSPSLRQYAAGKLQKIYRHAVRVALFEARLSGQAKRLGIPGECRSTFDQLMTSDLDELQPR